MSRGFSLMELVTVIVIAGILAAIALPQFNQPEIDASWYSEQVRAAVRYAQRQAVAQRRTVFVVVSSGAVDLCYDVGCVSPVSDFGTGAAYHVVPRTSGITLSPVTFWFNGLGQPSGAAAISVTGGAAITVAAETGYVQ
jgi:MSHA pilin protein MshC